MVLSAVWIVAQVYKPVNGQAVEALMLICGSSDANLWKLCGSLAEKGQIHASIDGYRCTPKNQMLEIDESCNIEEEKIC
jgi:hypothetical protein